MVKGMGQQAATDFRKKIGKTLFMKRNVAEWKQIKQTCKYNANTTEILQWGVREI